MSDGVLLRLFEDSVQQAFKATRDADVAEELAAEALAPIFADISEQPQLLADPDALEARRFRRVHARIFSWRRATRRVEPRERRLLLDMEANAPDPAGDSAIPDVLATRLEMAMQTLTEDERRAVLLIRAYDVPTPDAAMMLGTSIITLRKRLSRALEKLRNALNTSGEIV